MKGNTLDRTLNQKLRKIPGAIRIVRFLRSHLAPRERTLRKIRSSFPGRLLQPSPFTKKDRYPEFFAFVADQLRGNQSPRLMSFGCSTGEEVFSLRDYFPNATITGVDINPQSIAECKRKLSAMPQETKINFVCAPTLETQPAESYDAIFCMAVLRHGTLEADRPQNCESILSFSQVEYTVEDLSRCLTLGGYLSIWNSHFRFSDLGVASDFEVLLSDERGAWANQPLYGRDNEMLIAPPYCEAIFRKRQLSLLSA